LDEVAAMASPAAATSSIDTIRTMMTQTSWKAPRRPVRYRITTPPAGVRRLFGISPEDLGMTDLRGWRAVSQDDDEDEDDEDDEDFEEDDE
jgi:hypothetical protein